jgi:zinc transport system ATP-binding protein
VSGRAQRKHACKVGQYFDSTGEGERTLIDLEHVFVDLGGQPVLTDITFKLKDRMFLGVIGPNGAGKTTLLRVILGLIKPTGGSVCVMGMQPNELKGELHHIGYVPQNVLFDPIFPVSVYDVVMMGRICCIGRFRFAKRVDRQAVTDSIRMVGLDGLEKRLIGELSGGQQKRVFLARALCRETRILLLDEPTAGLDLPAQRQFMDLLTRLKEELGLSVVFVSHDVNVLAQHADEMVCINRSMHLHGKPGEVIGSDRLQDAYRCEFDFLVGSTGHHPGEGGAR